MISATNEIFQSFLSSLLLKHAPSLRFQYVETILFSVNPLPGSFLTLFSFSVVDFFSLTPLIIFFHLF